MSDTTADEETKEISQGADTRDTLGEGPKAWTRRRGVVGIVLLALVAAGTGAWWWSHRGLPDDVALRVGDQDVTVKEMRSRMDTVEALYGVKPPSADPERSDFWRDAAHSVAVGIVLADAAEAEDVAVSEADVDQAFQQFVTSFFGDGRKGRDAFATALGNAGTSEESVRDEFRRQLEINALFATITSDVEAPTDEAVVRAYEDRQCLLTLPEQRRIRNVVTPTRAGAREVLKQLRAGARFESVAAVSSIDGSTRQTGGDLGFVVAADLEEHFAAAAFSARRGELFGPVRSQFGWNVGTVETVRQQRIPKLSEAREQLRQALFVEAQSEVWREWIRGGLEAAEIEYADDYRPDDPLALPADVLRDRDAASDDSDC